MMVLEAQHLRKVFKSGGFFTASEKVAVHDLSFELKAGETLAIVGESGSGKSTTARLVMRLLEANQGKVSWGEQDVSKLEGKALRQQRQHIQMVFQDPFASLNPKMKILDTIAEGLRVHAPQLNAAQRQAKVVQTLLSCGLGEEVLQRYPHQFSGGQRQRIGIARALIVEPDVLVLDEPVSALDVSVQAQILNLLKQLQEDKGLAYLFISHDLSVVQHIADRVLVMFAGFVVEQGSIKDVFEHPQHPYTKALLDARPISHPKDRQVALDMQHDEGIAQQGCAFALRCPLKQEKCSQFDMQMQHNCACLFPLDKQEVCV
ncbi:MAG: ATP-binding cassette domain-containing protein [Mariprofundaceae bacterium]|nr:ATP-binding cassette domain-containing protein [Mariprofundaceae bacterium]